VVAILVGPGSSGANLSLPLKQGMKLTNHSSLLNVCMTWWQPYFCLCLVSPVLHQYI